MKFTKEEAEVIARPIIAKYASIMSRRHGLSRHDHEELSQEMFVGVVRRYKQFDASRGEIGAYFTTVIKNRGISALRLLHRMRESCRGRVTMEAASAEQAPAHDHAVVLDVRAKLKQLPGELRQVAVLLPKHDKREVAKRLGVSRATLYRRVEQLQEIFAEKA